MYSEVQEKESLPPTKKARPDSAVIVESSTTEQDLLALLPKEILLRIFQLLPLRDVLLGLSGTSRRCRTLGLDSVAELDLQDNFVITRRQTRHDLGLQEVKRLLERLTSLRCLLLPNYQGAKTSVALAIHALQCCLNLQELRVINCGSVETPDLFRAMGYCANWLRKIGLVNAKLGLPSPLKNLTHLSLHSCTVNDWAGIGKGCQGLEVLKARKCLNSDESEKEDFCEFLQEVRQSIRELDLTAYMFDEPLFFRLARCPKLERLHWTNAVVLGDSGLESILKIPLLRDLKLHFEDTAETGLQDVNYPRVFLGLRLERLEHLSLFNLHALNDDGVGAIAESCPGLLSFKLGHDVLVPITDIGVRSIVENCKKLRRLALIRCNWVTKAAFRNIREHLPVVENVYLEKCAKIKEDCTRELLELGIGVVDKWDDEMPPSVRVVRSAE